MAATARRGRVNKPRALDGRLALGVRERIARARTRALELGEDHHLAVLSDLLRCNDEPTRARRHTDLAGA